jgi:CheY-like chemotaxis protein
VPISVVAVLSLLRVKGNVSAAQPPGVFSALKWQNVDCPGFWKCRLIRRWEKLYLEGATDWRGGVTGAEKYSILIVDDDDMMRSYLRLILREAGFRIVGEVGDVAKAQKILKQQPVSAVFLDINLPGEDGLSALKGWRTAYPDTAIIMLSGESTLQNVQTAIAEGAKGFVSKPIAAGKVLQALHRAIGSQQP